MLRVENIQERNKKKKNSIPLYYIELLNYSLICEEKKVTTHKSCYQNKIEIFYYQQKFY
jgi:hypothetical protein